MADNKPDKQLSISAGQAMNIVLKAEQDAEQNISECKKLAHQTIQVARQHSAMITQRTNKRITTQHLRSKQAMTQHISELERSAANDLRNAHGTGLDEDKLTAAVNEVAAILIGLPDTGIPD
jgi:vacuolar-type H+-ATPase subunit H